MKLSSVIQSQREFFLTNETKKTEFGKAALLRLKQTIKEYEPEIYRALREDLGKSEYEAYLTEVSQALQEIQVAVSSLDKWRRPHRKGSSRPVWGSSSFTLYEPYGTALIISPWNYPFQLAILPLVSAMAAGNCVALKPSRNSANTARVIEEMLRSSFESHYIYVVGEGVSHDALLSQAYDYLFFTGSARVGRIIMRQASETLTPVTLELGGKSPCIVEKSANIRQTARKIIWGKLLNAGQTCVAPDFVLVEEEIREALIEALEEALYQLYGNPLENPDYPRIIDLHHYMRLKRLIEKEKKVIGGQWDEESLRIAPAILPEAGFHSECMKEEIFGPVLPIIAYGDIETPLEELRRRPKPLACYVFTENMGFAEKLVREYSFGCGCINDCVLQLANHNLPFGGVGMSGMGKYHGFYGFAAFSHEKAVLHSKRLLADSFRFPPFTAKKLEVLRKFLG